MNIEQMTDEQINACWDDPMPSGCGKSRYDIADAILAARDAQWNALIAGQAGEAEAPSVLKEQLRKANQQFVDVSVALMKYVPESEAAAKSALQQLGDAHGYGWCQSALGKMWDVKHGCAPRGSMGVTVKDCATQPTASNPWKEAVLEQLVAHGMDAPLSDPPAKIVKSVIDMAVTQALDPAINAPTASNAGERTPQDFAIEHAEYMARAAEYLITAVNDLAKAEQEVEEGSANDSDVDAARETLSEHLGSIRNSIYEFRKRRDRASLASKQEAQGGHVLELLNAISAAKAEFQDFFRYMNAGDNKAAGRCVMNAEKWLTRAATPKPQAEPQKFAALREQIAREGEYMRTGKIPQAEPAPSATAKVPLAVSSAPERIWLDLGFDPLEEDAHFSNLRNVTWSEDNATGNGIEYVRAQPTPDAPQTLVLDAARLREQQAIGAAIERACEHLPGGAELEIRLELLRAQEPKP